MSTYIKTSLFEYFNSFVGYHVTREDNINKILQNGLTLQNEKTFKEFNYKDGIYFSDTIMGAKMNLIDISDYLKKQLDEFVVIKFRLHDDSNIEVDKDMGNNSFVIYNSIPKKDIIEIITGDKFIKMNHNL